MPNFFKEITNKKIAALGLGAEILTLVSYKKY